MEQIVKTYGKMLLESVAVVLLIFFLFSSIQDEEGNKGIFKIVGAQLGTESTDYNTYTDFDTYMVESEKVYPEITFAAGSTIYRGTFSVSSYIKAVDYAGNEISLKVRSIINPRGNELIHTFNADTMEISFPMPGIYIMEVSATDREARKTVCTIRIPVN